MTTDDYFSDPPCSETQVVAEGLHGFPKHCDDCMEALQQRAVVIARGLRGDKARLRAQLAAALRVVDVTRIDEHWLRKAEADGYVPEGHADAVIAARAKLAKLMGEK